MNRTIIKIIGIITMTLDHIGVLLVAEDTTLYFILRGAGRIAFVLFAFMIAEGFAKTHDIKKYFMRLLVLAISIEVLIIAYSIAVNDFEYVLTINVIWPLVFGLGALILLSQKQWYIRILAIALVFIAEFLKVPYGAYGVMFIVIFGLYKNVVTQFLFGIGLNLLFIVDPLLSVLNLAQYAKYPDLQWLSLLAFPLIFIYNGKKGKFDSKWFFYLYYPAHMGILLAIRYLIF